MDPQSASAARREQPARLAGGAHLGRYAIERLLRRDVVGEVYQASEGGRALAVTLLDPRLVEDPAVMSQVASDLRSAAGVSHPALPAILELGHEGAHIFLVNEPSEGHTLRELLARKRETGQVGFGATGAANIALHLATALTSAHEALAHGGVSLDSVVVSREGKIRLTALGLAALAPLAARLGGARHATAPEVIAGARPGAPADLYGLGAVLYELLVGGPPVKGCARPSDVIAGLPPTVDQLIARCMAQNPASRPATAGEVQAALTQAMASRATQSQAGKLPGKAAASLSESLAPGRGGAKHSLPPIADDERWLVSKGKLDYGPFTMAHIIDQIRTHQILPGHVVIEKDSGTRTKVEDHPLLHEIVETARHKRDEERRANAEVHHARQEKRRGATLYGVIAVAVVALGGGGYFLYGKLTSHKDRGSGAISSLETGSVETKLSFPGVAERKARRTARAKNKAAAPAGAKGGWDDTLDLDMEDESGGDERLDDSQVNPVLQRSGGKLGGCLRSTGTRDAKVEFIVLGTGKVSQVRVNGETGSAVANCVRGAMKAMQFPSFNGPRSKHYFDMAL